MALKLSKKSIVNCSLTLRHIQSVLTKAPTRKSETWSKISILPNYDHSTPHIIGKNMISFENDFHIQISPPKNKKCHVFRIIRSHIRFWQDEESSFRRNALYYFCNSENLSDVSLKLLMVIIKWMALIISREPCSSFQRDCHLDTTKICLWK